MLLDGNWVEVRWQATLFAAGLIHVYAASKVVHDTKVVGGEEKEVGGKKKVCVADGPNIALHRATLH